MMMTVSLREDILECRECALCMSCRSPVPTDVGSTLFSWMIVGEAPGEDEDEQGIPFVGRSGKLLDWTLEESGLERSQFTVTNVVKCRPPGNRLPSQEERGACFHWFDRELQVFNPSMIMMLGKTSYESLFPYSSGFVHGGMFCRDERQYVSLYHPSYWLRNGGMRYASEFVVPVLRNLSKTWR